MALEDTYNSNVSSDLECLIFDLDDTLYPLSSGLALECTKNIIDYMVQKLGIEENKAAEMNQFLYRNYGTSIAGLKALGYDFDNDDYHSFVHGRLPYEKIKPDNVLRSLLLSLPMRKIIFSNGDKVHVSKVLNKLKLEDCFDGVICFESLNPVDKTSASSNPHSLDKSEETCQSDLGSAFHKTPILCKPFEAAFQLAFKLANINPQKTVFFDDSIRNIQTAKQMGLKTVLVGTSNRPNGADYALESIHNVREALPELWEANSKSETRMHKGEIAIETSVTA